MKRDDIIKLLPHNGHILHIDVSPGRAAIDCVSCRLTVVEKLEEPHGGWIKERCSAVVSGCEYGSGDICTRCGNGRPAKATAIGKGEQYLVPGNPTNSEYFWLDEVEPPRETIIEVTFAGKDMNGKLTNDRRCYARVDLEDKWHFNGVGGITKLKVLTWKIPFEV